MMKHPATQGESIEKRKTAPKKGKEDNDSIDRTKAVAGVTIDREVEETMKVAVVVMVVTTRMITIVRIVTEKIEGTIGGVTTVGGAVETADLGGVVMVKIIAGSAAVMGVPVVGG